MNKTQKILKMLTVITVILATVILNGCGTANLKQSKGQYTDTEDDYVYMDD